MFDNRSSSLKVLVLAGMIIGCSVAVAISALVFQRLPVFLVNMLDRLGILPSGIMPYWILWSILFLPLQFVISIAAMVGSMFPGLLFLLSLDSFKIFIDKLR